MSISGSVRPLVRAARRDVIFPRFPRARPFTNSSSKSGILGLHRPDNHAKHIARENTPKPEPRRPDDPEKWRPFIKYPPPPSSREVCKDPVKTVGDAQIKLLDPKGARTRLFSPTNPEAAKVGDIILVRNKGERSFAGVLLSIKKRGVDTAILLRNQLTRVGVEMWYKIYSPNVEGMEVVQRRQRRARRARLFYMRKPKHDLGSVENIVARYVRQRQALRGGDAKGRDADSHKRRKAKSK